MGNNIVIARLFGARVGGGGSKLQKKQSAGAAAAAPAIDYVQLKRTLVDLGERADDKHQKAQHYRKQARAKDMSKEMRMKYYESFKLFDRQANDLRTHILTIERLYEIIQHNKLTAEIADVLKREVDALRVINNELEHGADTADLIDNLNEQVAQSFQLTRDMTRTIDTAPKVDLQEMHRELYHDADGEEEEEELVPLDDDDNDASEESASERGRPAAAAY